uniref:Uncharacterized protein n=1 Tax=Arundo donax TaxID=35708 RepID=A0A0A9CLM3_ARUDO
MILSACMKMWYLSNSFCFVNYPGNGVQT